jgi:hypothetical protein
MKRAVAASSRAARLLIGNAAKSLQTTRLLPDFERLAMHLLSINRNLLITKDLHDSELGAG